MKGMNSRLAVIPVAMAAMIGTAAAAQQTFQPAVANEAPTTKREIDTVAVGKPSTPSPEGTFTIQRRVANPTYHHDGKTVLPGPNNPVGTRWMGLSKPGYGIHGTNEPRSIGKAASHGCIRMAKADLEEFYTMVAVGDTVRLIGHRDEETARLFGPADVPVPAGANESVQTANTDAPPAASEPAPVTATVVSMGTR